METKTKKSIRLRSSNKRTSAKLESVSARKIIEPAKLSQEPKKDSGKKSKEKISRKKTIEIVILILIFLVLIFGLIFSIKNLIDTKNRIKALSSGNSATSNDKKLTKAEEDNIISKIKKHIELPSDENPIIAEVANIESLLQTEPVFYKNAKNGDIVLIYEKAKKAFLYSPGQDILVNSGPISIGEETKN